MTLNKATISSYTQAILLVSYFGTFLAVRAYMVHDTLEALFLAAGLVGTIYTAYRIIRGIVDPSWLDAEIPPHESSEPRYTEEDTEDDE